LNKIRSFCVIGGGIIGLATAYRIAELLPDSEVTVLEKESLVGTHQSGNNSGVLHAGIYYKPGSLKARLAVRGIEQMTAFCAENGISHEICGKIIVATDPEEQSRLQALLKRGQQNGLKNLKMLRFEEIREIEPHAGGIAALHVPQEGIVDYKHVCAVLQQRIRGRVVTDARVYGLRQTGNGWIALTSRGDFEAQFLINCAGLQCDRVAKMAGEKPSCRIVPFRGEYYKLRSRRQHLVRNLIYPVPDPKFPFLGVHFTRLIHGGVEAGPNAVLALSREGYHKSDVNLADVYALAYPGLWRFVLRYPRMCFDELRRSFSKRLFCAALRKLVPDLQESDLEPGGVGVRAQALTPDGNLVQDFSILQRPQCLHLLNAPSPGATASLAIAEEIVNRIVASEDLSHTA